MTTINDYESIKGQMPYENRTLKSTMQSSARGGDSALSLIDQKKVRQETIEYRKDPRF